MSLEYDKKNKRLVYIQKKATEEFWDKLWIDENLRKHILFGKNDRFVSLLTKLFIYPKKDSRVIDAGCGKGQYVYSLHHQGYSAYGIDFAPKIIDAIQNAVPEINVREGDVRSMPFPEKFFDGYWSLGVIEHFYFGYQPILKEMFRVIKPGGYLFITFPYMSPLRRIKSFLGLYPLLKNINNEPNGFYQFALNHRQVRRDILQHGFKLRLSVPLDGFNGLKNELHSSAITRLFHFLQKNGNPFIKILRYTLYFLFLPISGHSILMIFKKQ